MSPYLLIYIYVIFVACMSWHLKRDVIHHLYIITMLLLCSFLALHYGQGSDYFSYERMFNYWRDVHSLNAFVYASSNMHGEILWHGIEWLCSKLNMNFQCFIVLLAIIEFYELYRYVNLYCQYNRIWAILLTFPTIYLTFMFGAIRQGLVICTFMGYMLPFLTEKKLIKYYVCAILMLLIHSSAIVFFIIPIFILLKIKMLYGCIAIALGLSWILGASSSQILLHFTPFIKNIVARMGEYSIYIPAICERMVMFVLITYLYYKKRHLNSQIDNIFYKIYTCSIIIYCLFINYSLTASRLSFALRTVEIALIIHSLNKLPEIRKLICFVLLMFNILMCCKNLTAYLYQGGYEGIKFWNYPYISVFNKDAILKYNVKYLY